MPQGFFSVSETAVSRSKHVSSIPRCASCKLHRTCISPRMEPSGDGRMGIAIVAEAPGQQEDKRGTQLIGDAGVHLKKKLRSLGIDLHKDCWKINAVNCRPKNNRTPSEKEIESCRPFVMSFLRKAKPKVVLLLGGSAVSSVVGATWNRSVGGIGRWRGFQIPCRNLNAWLCPAFHPSYLLRDESEPADVIWTRDLRRAVLLRKRDVPVYKDERELVDILREADARKYLRALAKGTKTVAFDYETTGLNPFAEGHRVVSCAFSDKPDHAVAFMITDAVKGPLRRVLRSYGVKKIASNMKFEEKWSRRFLRCRVRSWWFDTMVAAHVLDQRKEVTSLKFQAYVRYGMPDYEEGVHHLLKGRGKSANAFNRIDQIDTKTLLTYNGVDALLERRLTMDMQKEMP